MRIAVCDDCPEDAFSLKSKLTMHEVTVYSGASDLLTDIEGGKQFYDLYLLDIYMDKSMNGLELAEKLRNIHEEAVICFVSTSDEFYREAYDLYAIQYLIKPVAKEQLEKLLAKVQKMLARGNEQKLVYSWRGRFFTVKFAISEAEGILFIFAAQMEVPRKARENSMIWSIRYAEKFLCAVIRALSSICIMWRVSAALT